jgi:hypothetical protein
MFVTNGRFFHNMEKSHLWMIKFTITDFNTQSFYYHFMILAAVALGVVLFVMSHFFCSL